MTAAYRQPYITLTRLDGSVTPATGDRRQLPVELDARGNPIPVGLTADTAFPDGLVFGDSAKRSDQRTAQIIWDDWAGGAGQAEYTETEGINSFTDSTLDTRYQKSLVLPPEATQLGGDLGSAVTSLQRGRYLGYSQALHVVWGGGGALGHLYNSVTSAWVAFTTRGISGQARDVVQAQGQTYIATLSSLYRSADGVTWAAIGLPTVPANTVGLWLAQYDNKLFCLAQLTGGTVATLYWSTDYATATTAGWNTGPTVQVANPADAQGEAVVKLFTWRLPTNPGYPALWLQTTHHLLYYDEGGPKWQEWETINRGQLQTYNLATATVWRRNGNLYVYPGEYHQRVTEYTGATQDVLGPNERGGLPAQSGIDFNSLDGNSHWLVAFGNNHLPIGVPITSEGRVWAMNDAHGWHCVYRTAGVVRGGWVGPDALYAFTTSGAGQIQVLALPFPDEATIPQNALGANKRYRTNATYSLETAWTDGGTPYVNKRALWTFLDPRLPDGTSGIPAGTTLRVYYKTDRDTGWSALTDTLQADSAWPYQATFQRNGIAIGKVFKRIKFRLDLFSSDPTATPDLATMALHFIRRPRRRYSYTVRLDLRDGAPAFADTTFNNYSASALRAWLVGLQDNDDAAGGDDAMVQLEYGGDGDTLSPTRRVVALGDMVVTPVEDPTSGMGRYSVTIRDLTPPPSG